MRYGICFLYCFLKLSFELAPCFNLRDAFFFTALEISCINVLCILIGSIECARLLPYRVTSSHVPSLCRQTSLLSSLRSGRFKQRLIHFYVCPFWQLTLWGIRVEDSEIVNYMKTAGLLIPIHKGLVRAHFNMEDTSGPIIFDQAGNNYHGTLVGGPSLILVGNFDSGQPDRK